MKVRAVGPYLFIRYNGRQGVTAVVETNKGRLQVSAANLLPVQTKGWERMTRYGPLGTNTVPDLKPLVAKGVGPLGNQGEGEGNAGGSQGESSWWGSSHSSDHELPPGVIV